MANILLHVSENTESFDRLRTSMATTHADITLRVLHVHQLTHENEVKTVKYLSSTILLEYKGLLH
jgi:hypothetical protein